jgi:transposase InsO family protein
VAYRFIEENHLEFGVRWLLRRLHIHPNAYYNYRKHRKTSYQEERGHILQQIEEVYHEHNGVAGYRQIQVYLARKGIKRSALTIHVYMNQILGLHSIVRPKKPDYCKGKPHKIFPNLLNQDFTGDGINKKWCTDFTYLFLKDGSKRYNCTIIDLYDRSVIASITDKKITADLARRTLQKALNSQSSIDGSLILHSDQGSQYTSKEFVDFCESVGVIQSMSKAGYPYDNAPMERYFNTLKNELINQHEYRTEAELYESIEEFAYVTYNHVRPHSYNGYRTPFEVRCKVA